MIHAKCYCAGGSLHLTLRGHAGAAPRGQDLVCAGVSALACTLAETVERMYEQRMLRRCPRVELGQGSAEIIAVPKNAFFREAAIVFWTVQSGIGALAGAFPENVKLDEAMKMERSGAERREA